MRKSISTLLVSSLLLSACGTFSDSRINPMTWFGGSETAPVATSETSSNPLIPQKKGLFAGLRARNELYEGQPLEQITDLTVEPVPGGVIVRATGLAARQGVYAVQLTPENIDELPVDGVLTYRLEGLRAEQNTGVGAIPTREVVAARAVTHQNLRGVHTIRVEGQQNAQISRR
jgi:hypothetical protein